MLLSSASAKFGRKESIVLVDDGREAAFFPITAVKQVIVEVDSGLSAAAALIRLDEASARQKSAAIVLGQDDCKGADSAVTSLRDDTVRFAQQRDRMLTSTRNTNPHKSNRPAKLRRLPTSSCIQNAGGVHQRINHQLSCAAALPIQTFMTGGGHS
jgi:hypothetical protein